MRTALKTHSYAGIGRTTRPGENQENHPYKDIGIFFHIDEHALNSNVRNRHEPSGFDPWGYVDFVDGYWVSIAEQRLEDPELEPEILDEPVEGCREEDVGWMMRWTRYVDADFFADMAGYEAWYNYYSRPPSIPEIECKYRLC